MSQAEWCGRLGAAGIGRSEGALRAGATARLEAFLGDEINATSPALHYEVAIARAVAKWRLEVWIKVVQTCLSARRRHASSSREVWHQARTATYVDQLTIPGARRVAAPRRNRLLSVCNHGVGIYNRWSLPIGINVGVVAILILVGTDCAKGALSQVLSGLCLHLRMPFWSSWPRPCGTSYDEQNRREAGD